MALYDKNGHQIDEQDGQLYYVGGPNDGKPVTKPDGTPMSLHDAADNPNLGITPDSNDQAFFNKAKTAQSAEAINAQDMASLPKVEDYNLIDSATGLMKSAYQLHNPAAMADEQNAIGKVADFANNTGTSAYAQAQMDQNKLQDLQQRGDLAGAYNTNISTGMKTLGQTGGYDSGARERIIMGAGRGLSTGGQKIGAATAYQDLGIRATDEQNKIGMMKELPGLYGNLGTRQTGINQYNIDKATGSINTNYTNALERAKLGLQNTQNIRESQAVK